MRWITIRHEHSLADDFRSFLEHRLYGLIRRAVAEALNDPAGIMKELKAMTEASDRLAREVGETRDAVTALTGRYQTKIDAMQVEIDNLKAALENGDTAAAVAAADALDQLQTDMTQLGNTPAPPPEEPPAEPPPA